MNTITIPLSDDCFAKLQEVAARYNVSVEDLARMSVEELTTGHDEAFQKAVEYVIDKNAELYRRLAQ